MAKKTHASFDFEPGRELRGAYKVVRKLGAGWEGEVYKVEEIDTGIPRAAKFFFPDRNRRNKVIRHHARVAFELRRCSILVPYIATDTIVHAGEKVSFLLSEFVKGTVLSDFLKRQRGGRMSEFEALRLLYALSRGMVPIHLAGHYHGDLHAQNVMIARYGLDYELKVFDFFQWSDSKRECIFDDVLGMIQIFYECLGGVRHYRNTTQATKEIVCGLKHSLIRKKFKNALNLRNHLEQINFLDQNT